MLTANLHCIFLTVFFWIHHQKRRMDIPIPKDIHSSFPILYTSSSFPVMKLWQQDVTHIQGGLEY